MKRLKHSKHGVTVTMAYLLGNYGSQQAWVKGSRDVAPCAHTGRRGPSLLLRFSPTPARNQSLRPSAWPRCCYSSVAACSAVAIQRRLLAGMGRGTASDGMWRGGT
jgi:hypothetical protein